MIRVCSIDPFDLFRYVPDGTVLRFGKTTIGCLGGIETANPEEKQSIDQRQYERLLAASPGEIDILITHDAPYGVGTNYYGETQGSRRITALIERLQPKYLIAGHYHHAIGPHQYGDTTYFGLNVIMNLRKEQGGPTEPGWMAVLDTDRDELTPVADEWPVECGEPFPFQAYCANLRANRRP
ncbi:hypothetical protein PAESOLCIP111_02360 [Paenibacillus solanacearum]|uniref:Calcineurin-like phosphoesterase domain-containing protein n=1 Tax=Paenibacillus solanacearum TaxID=2048548 RepID=A0A916K2V2_9BACL|nr:metallophosphoesterase [Paenibacillus solanacearum]CAG7621724.1 hypothetical protein PAESOLCIP111_02360 [Paenibacillus solanacearum]